MCVLIQHKVEEHFGQLVMGKRQGPKSQVGSGVGNSVEDELDCLNHLVDKSISERVLMVIFT